MMKFSLISAKLLMLIALGFVSSFALASCGDDDTPAGNNSGGDNGGNSGGGGSNPVVRTLSVSINTRGLHTEDVITGGDVQHLKNVLVGKVIVTIDDLPNSVAEIKKLKLPNGMTAISDSPYLYPILLVAAINKMSTDINEAKAMINYVSNGFSQKTIMGKNYHFPEGGAADVYGSDWSQLRTQYQSYDEIRSFIDGATYFNNYSPEKPYSMTMELKNPSSYSAVD